MGDMADEFMIREIKKLEAENAELKEEISGQFIDMTKLVSEYQQEIAELTKALEYSAHHIVWDNYNPPTNSTYDCIKYFLEQAKEIIRKKENDEKDSDD